MTSHLSNLDVGDDGGGAEEGEAELGEHFKVFFAFLPEVDNKTKVVHFS